MAVASEINPCIGGMAGKKVVVVNSEFDAGLSVTTPLTAVEYVFVTENDASASGEQYSWSATGGTVQVEGDLGLIANLSVLIVGY